MQVYQVILSLRPKLKVETLLFYDVCLQGCSHWHNEKTSHKTNSANPDQTALWSLEQSDLGL